MMHRRNLMRTAGGLLVDDVFSTDLFTANGSNQTITSGIDLAGYGGLVWEKLRSTAGNHWLVDTDRGANKVLRSDTTGAETDNPAFPGGFTSTGHSSGTHVSGQSVVARTYRKSPRFFDVVTYTGNGVAGRTIPHNLGVTPGMMIVKRRSSTGTWLTYHRDTSASPGEDYMAMNSTQAAAKFSGIWNNTEPTETDFTVGNFQEVNSSGSTYVAYLFAHDPEPDGIIRGGVYTGNRKAATGPTVTLGWEPQFLLMKSITSTEDWVMVDNMRSPSNPRNKWLYPNLSEGEYVDSDGVSFSPTGFQVTSTNPKVNDNSTDYLYMAIRAEGA